jgi:chaperonin GroES
MHDRVLVERMPQVTHSGSIIIPETARKPAIWCKVIAVGPGRWEDGVFTKTAVKPGGVVLVPHAERWLGNLADYKDGERILIQAGDIGAIVG